MNKQQLKSKEADNNPKLMHQILINVKNVFSIYKLSINFCKEQNFCKDN